MLTERERETLQKLKRFSTSEKYYAEDLKRAFGEPFQVYREVDGSIGFIWQYPSKIEDLKNSVGLVFTNQKLSVIQYSVPKKFSILWHDGIKKE